MKERARGQLEGPHVVPSKKRKAIPLELDERQQRASACVLELGLHYIRRPLIGTLCEHCFQKSPAL